MFKLTQFTAAFILFLTICVSLKVNAQEYKVVGYSENSGNNSDIIDYNIPGKLNPGQDYIITITAVNNGSYKWTRNENYYLKPYDSDAGSQANIWGVSRVELPNDVNPSDKVIFSFSIKAPQNSGEYNLRWAMAKDNEYFGEYTSNTVSVGTENISQVNNESGNSEFVSVTVPETMVTGEKYKVKMTIRNTENVEWLPSPASNEYKISPVTGSSEVTYPDWNSAPVYFSSSILPGQVSDVEFDVTAPLDPGVYDLQWMMKKGNDFFGQKSNKVTVNVSRNSSPTTGTKTLNASFISQSVPTAMEFNELKEISITMSNTGSKTWTKGSEQLVITDPKMSPVTINVWNTGYMQLPKNVEPGGLVTFVFNVKPTETGWQYFQCSMMGEDGSLFGSPSQSVEVIVSKK